MKKFLLLALLLPMISFGASTNLFNNVVIQGQLTTGPTFVTNGNVSVNGNQPKVVLTETNSSQISGANAATRIEMYAPGYANGIILGGAYSTNSIATGSLPGDTAFRAESNTRQLFANGTTIQAYFDYIPAVKSLILTNGTRLDVSGAATFRDSVTISTNLNVLGSYQVGGTPGISGSFTNMVAPGVSNILVYGKGLLTNSFTIP